MSDYLPEDEAWGSEEDSEYATDMQSQAGSLSSIANQVC